MENANLTIPYFSTGFKRLWSPWQDIETQFLKEVAAAEKSIYMIIYGFHLPKLTDILLAKKQAGISVKCIFDLTQSRGKAELVEIKRILDAQILSLIGKSPVAGQIIHEKMIILDEVKTISGSWNFSLSAQKQVNHMDFIYSKEMAQTGIEIFNELWSQVEAEAKK